MAPVSATPTHLRPMVPRKVVVVGDRDPQSEYKKLVACMNPKTYCDYIYEGIRAGRLRVAIFDSGHARPIRDKAR